MTDEVLAATEAKAQATTATPQIAVNELNVTTAYLPRIEVKPENTEANAAPAGAVQQAGAAGEPSANKPLAPTEQKPVIPAPSAEAVKQSSQAQPLQKFTPPVPQARTAAPMAPSVVRPDFVPAKPNPALSAPRPPSQPPKATKTKAARRRNPLLPLLIALLVVALSGVIGLAVVTRYFDGEAKIGTNIAGTSVTGQSEQQLIATVDQMVKPMKLVLGLGSQQYQFDLGALGVTIDAKQTAGNALAADDLGGTSWWPFRTADVPLVMKYSTEDLQTFIDDTFLGDAQRPVNASVVLDSSKQQFTTTSDVDGQSVDITPITDAIKTLAAGGAVTPIQLSTSTVPAEISASAAQDAANTANDMLKQTFTFQAKSKSYTLKANQLANWITATPDPSSHAITIGVNNETLAKQLPGILNTNIADPPVNERVLYTPGGVRIANQTWGRSGTVVSNTGDAVSALQSALAANQALNFQVSIAKKAAKTVKVTVGGAYDKPHGSKWIDVNQSTFKVTLWEGTTLIKRFTCVTGAAITPSHNGTFYIYSKYTSVTMRGHNADGTPYVSPDVPWTSFYNGGEALHGAPWRSSFGYRGSHGCINLPVSVAHFIFNWAPLGTRVVVHW